MTVIAEEWSCTVKEWSLTVTVALVTISDFTDVLKTSELKGSYLLSEFICCLIHLLYEFMCCLNSLVE